MTTPTGSPTRARLATMAAFFINGGAIATWAANIPSVREHLGLSPSTLGFTLLSLAVGSVLALAIAGRMSALFGSRNVTIVTATLAIPLMVALIAAPNLPLLVVALFVFGFFISMMDVTMNAHGVLVEQKLGKPIMSSLHAFWSAGSLVGAGAASVLLRQGMSPLNYALLAASVLGVIALVMRAYVGEGAIADWSAVYIRDYLHTDHGLAVGGLVAFNLAMFVARLVGDPIRARFNSEALLRVSGVLAALGMSLVLLAPVPWLAFLGFVLTGLGFSNVVPVLFSAAGNLSGIPAATGVAAVAAAGYAGFLAGPPLIGTLAGVVTLRGSLLLVVIFAVLIALFATVLRQDAPAKAQAKAK